jgi:hypothetical protein
VADIGPDLFVAFRFSCIAYINLRGYLRFWLTIFLEEFAGKLTYHIAGHLGYLCSCRTVHENLLRSCVVAAVCLPLGPRPRPCLVLYTPRAGRTLPAGEGGCTAGSLPPSHYLKLGPAVRCRSSPEFPFRFIWVLAHARPAYVGGEARHPRKKRNLRRGLAAYTNLFCGWVLVSAAVHRLYTAPYALPHTPCPCRMPERTRVQSTEPRGAKGGGGLKARCVRKSSELVFFLYSPLLCVSQQGKFKTSLTNN